MTESEKLATKLKPNWIRFADLIIEGMPQCQAALQVMPKLANSNTAGVVANRLLRNNKIEAYIEAKKAEISQRTTEKIVFTKIDALQRFLKIADRCSEMRENNNETNAVREATKIIGGYEADNEQKAQNVTDIVAIMQQVRLGKE